MRVAGRPLVERFQRQGLPTNDYDMLDSFRIAPADKPARYAQMLRELPSGLSERAVHPGLATPEAQVIDDGWPVRQTDFDFLSSPNAKDLIDSEGIVLLSYRPLQKVWRESQR